MKILIIDDSYEIRDILRLIVEKQNHEVFAAVDGQDGLQKAKEHHPDLIIIDALMPKVDGFTFLRNIKKDPSLFTIPCVFLSAIYTSSTDRKLALSLGAEVFIPKPFDVDTFWKEVAPILERKKQPAPPVVEDEEEFLKSYNRTVVTKLEEKVKELEVAFAKSKQTEEALHKSEAMFKGLFESSPDAIVVIDDKGRIVSVNQRLERLFGYNRDEIFGSDVELLMPEYLRYKHKELRNGYLSQPSARPMGASGGLFARRKDGSEFPVDVMLSPVATSGGALVLSVIRDITEHKRLEGEIKRLFAAIDQSVNMVFISDAKGNIEFVNSTFERITGYQKEEVIGRNPRMLASGETTGAEYAKMWGAIAAGKTWRGVFKNKKKNRQPYWSNGLISPITDENGKVTHFLAMQEDVTEKMQSEERLRYLATYDELTGVFNRTHFVKRLTEWITYAETNKRAGVLLLINLDKFKLINDTYGHSVGDDLLRAVAGALKDAVLEIDAAYTGRTAEEGAIVGRLGGDEFAVLLPSRDEAAGLSVSEIIRGKIEAFRFAEITGNLTSSIGVVSYPKHGITAKDLFAKADAAIYLAKEQGYNKTRLYHEGDFVLEKMRSRVVWRDHIHKALAEDRFVPWFQPILSLSDNNINHYEALARMRDAEGTIVLPGSFIDIAEEMGLVTEIDRVIIEKTLRVQVALSKKGLTPSFSVNLSGKELGDEGLLEFLRNRITATGADPGRLTFEITETAAIRELDKAVKFIRELRSLGCRFSLDDFGVGFTSFKYLKEMEVDYIKIDGSFIRKLHENKTDRLFVKAIADVAKGMGIKTTAEFVENEEIICFLREYGVDYAQGYFIGKPSPDIAGMCIGSPWRPLR